MNARLVVRLITCLALLGLATAGCAPARPAGESAKTVRLMAIGNSFSWQGTTYLREMAKNGGHKLVWGHAQIGGASMDKHVAAARAHDADPKDPRGKPYKISLPSGKTRMESLQEVLQSQDWDYVTIQQASLQCADPLSYRPGAEQLLDYIHKYAPHARVVLHETWAYRDDDPLFDEETNQEEMYQHLHQIYANLQRELGAVRIIPTGTAFQNARRDPRWQLEVQQDVDWDSFVPPDLPSQVHSLNVGYYWIKEKGKAPKFAFDGHHLSPAGKYLASAVWYEVFFGDARYDKIIPEGLSAEDAAFLREIAHKTVQAQHAAPLGR